MRRPRILQWVGQRSETTVDQRGEENYIQNGHFRTPCRSRVIHQFWKRFVLHIATAGLVKFIFKSSIRAKWRSNSTQVVQINTKNPKQKKKMSLEMRTTVSDIFLSGWRSSQIIQKTQNCLHPYTVLRTQIRNILRKWYQNRESTVFILTFDVCSRTKMTRAPCRRHTGEALPRAEKFGDLITADQKVINEGCESRDNHRYAVVVRNIATQWIKSYPSKTQRLHTRRERVYESSSSRHTHQKSLTPTFHWNLEPPHRSETNGFSERAVRRVKEGSPAVLLQSGLDERWWSDSMECCRYLRSVKDLLADGKTPYERRFGESFRGPVIPFGAMVECYPISARDQSRNHQFGKKVLPELFFGYASIAVRIWKGDIMVADIEELENIDASETRPRRTNAKEVLTPQLG